jgi:hypothetical protein
MSVIIKHIIKCVVVSHYFFYIFQKSRHPEVNKYLDSVLATVRNLLTQNFIEKVVMLIKEDKSSKPVERFVFELNSFFKTTQR